MDTGDKQYINRNLTERVIMREFPQYFRLDSGKIKDNEMGQKLTCE